MKSYPYLIACPHCGGVYRLRPLVGNDVAQCGRCLSILYHASSMDPARVLPLAFAAGVTFLMANVCPVMTVSFHGLTHNVTLWQSMWSLAQGDTVLLAWCAVLFLILAPSLQIMLLTWILLFASARRRAPGFIAIMKTLRRLRPWNMMEVGLPGFLVAAVKLSGLLDVSVEPGGWFLVASLILVLIITRQDNRWLWALGATVHRGKAHHE
ncbi:paraquat-inducible protein A [Dickeya dadantii]|uniref:paraquat-inducible protein A n=1 Tax=Dickeya dadantii TaxID=204038 RepID=UPI001C0E0F76|nr:paraquat-inducible protein A [Dickeya dadantii]QWT40849.1 paraquat-inducible protein A [Dickeya dadantii]